MGGQQRVVVCTSESADWPSHPSMHMAGAAIPQPAARDDATPEAALAADSSQQKRTPRPSRELMGAAGDDEASAPAFTRASSDPSVTDRAIGWLREVRAVGS